MEKNRCIIFDLDDTLVDSEALSNRALLDLIPDISYTLNELISRNRGRKLAHIFHDIENNIGRKLSEDFEPIYRSRVKSLFSSELKANENVLQTLKSIPFNKCVASSGPISKIRHALKTTGLESFFGDNIFSSYEINSWKPLPDIFLYAAKSMKAPVENCIVIEDSLVGIEASIAANMIALHYVKNEKYQKIANIEQFSDMSDLPTLIQTIYSTRE